MEDKTRPGSSGTGIVFTRLSAALLVVLAVVMLGTFRDYGISGDAGVQHRWGRRLLRWYATLGDEPRVTDNLDITKYGGFCEIVTELIVKVSPLGTYESRHLANLGFAFVAFLAVWSMGRRLGGPAAGFFSLLVLALTPPFYGHAFFNAKDIPFAAMYALATAAVLAANDWPRRRWWRVLAAGVAIGLAAAVRVGGISLFGFALVLWIGTLVVQVRGSGDRSWPARGDLVRLGVAWGTAVGVGWAVMVAFWPWAMLDPFRNPLRAMQRFARYWPTMGILYDGQVLPSQQVSRFYLPNWLALTLPELYLVAVLLGVIGLAAFWWTRSAPPGAWLKVLQGAWLASIPVALVSGVVITHMPLYDGLRHFLFLIPLLAVVAGTAVAVFLGAPLRRGVRIGGVSVLCAACLVTLVDMVRLHPYESVYFNRLWAGGMKAGVDRYDADYWCLSYKEGCEWLRRRFAGASCRRKVRVASYSIMHQTDHYLHETEEGRRLFVSVPLSKHPNYVLATTRFQDHLRAPGRPVFTVERMGATIFYLFEVEPPDCAPPARSASGD